MDQDAVLKLEELSSWHQEMLMRLMGINFKGRDEIKIQLATADFKIFDGESLMITPRIAIAAPVVQTIPVEAEFIDIDGNCVSVLLFIRKFKVHMLEVLRWDNESLKPLPPVNKFRIFVKSDGF